MTKWKCGGCGYIWDGGDAPEVCPKCGATKDKFEKLEESAAKLVERSRHTNCLQAKLVALSREIEEICNAGIEDKLDPGCVDVFTKSRDHAWEMMKMAMAEIQIHVKRNKWG